jgi:hypothetical protein
MNPDMAERRSRRAEIVINRGCGEPGPYFGDRLLQKHDVHHSLPEIWIRKLFPAMVKKDSYVALSIDVKYKEGKDVYR